MGSVGNMLFGGGSGASSGGAGGTSDLTNGLQDQSNELLVGLGPTRQARQEATQQFVGQLQAQAMGKAPSIANAQLQMALDKNLQQQIAAAKANRSINPALAARMNVQQGNQMAMQAAQQGAVNRLAEQQQAQNQYANFLGQQNQLSLQARAAAMGGANAAANIDAANQARSDRMVMGLAQAGASAATMSDKNLKTLVKKYNKGGVVKMADGGLLTAAQAKGMSQGFGQMEGPGRILNVAGGEQYGGNEMSGQNMQQMGQNFGQLLSKLGQPTPQVPVDMGVKAGNMYMMSKGAVVPGHAKVSGDSEKNDVVPALLSPGEVVVPRTVVAKGSKAVAKFVAQAIKEKQGTTTEVQKKAEGGKVDQFDPKQFLNSLQAVSYEYKKDAEGPGVGPGRRLGVMAQDLEKAGPVGRSMVKETPNGKQVDMGAGFGAILAAQAHLNERLQALESKYGKKK